MEILSPGLLTTVQDLGRSGYERFGVPRSGAMDWFSLRAANFLVNNPESAAGLEFLGMGPEIRVTDDCLVAAAGRGFDLVIGGRSTGLFRCALARAGEVIQIIPGSAPGWGYLAVSGGGIAVEPVMGSRSTYLRGGFGGHHGRLLQPGDILPAGGELPANWMRMAGRRISPRFRLDYQDEVNVAVVPGPQLDYFGKSGTQVFFNSEFQILPTSDRMGYRLSGEPVPREIKGELVSEGIAGGSIQIPPDGQPIVLMSDRPVTGGYPKIATVTSAGLPLIAQAMPGAGRVRFHEVSVEQAQAQYRGLLKTFQPGVFHEED